MPEAGESASHISSSASVGNEAVNFSSEQHTQPASLTPFCVSDENEDVNLSGQQLTLDCAVDNTVRIQHWVSQILHMDSPHLPEDQVSSANTGATDNICEDIANDDSASTKDVPLSDPVPHDDIRRFL
ncbi:hypothetical protein CHARACLAT_010226 [Characodon lateralis]|uniref:Uncharacterized protein n=1 Tax=Characodon lateralis TaxID=208331 RepID=A0ABU7CYD7_9TELE|nr:hypothetical protein [Characodon lateralis]